MSETKRYTLPLPETIYDEIQRLAETYDRSMKDVLQQCLRFGLTVIKITEDPNSEIIFREKLPPNGANEAPVVKDQVVKVMW